MKPLRTIETDALYVHELERDVHYVEMKSKKITRTAFQDMMEAHLSLSEGKKVYVISDHSKASQLTRKAMLFAKNYGNQACHTIILINNSKAARMLSEFFVTVARPSFKAVMVEDFEAAMNWIQKIKIDQQEN